MKKRKGRMEGEGGRGKEEKEGKGGEVSRGAPVLAT